MKRVIPLLVAVLLPGTGLAASAAPADVEADYNRRVAGRFGSLFQTLDRNRDGVVTRNEAQGDLHFYPRFDDMDINRDGFVTQAELSRFVEQEFGVRLEFGATASAASR